MNQTSSVPRELFLDRALKGARSHVRAHAAAVAVRLVAARISPAQASAAVRAIMSAPSPTNVSDYFKGIQERAGRAAGGWNAAEDGEEPLAAALSGFLGSPPPSPESGSVTLPKALYEQARLIAQQVREEMGSSGDTASDEVNEVWQRLARDFASYLSGWFRIEREVRGGGRV